MQKITIEPVTRIEGHAKVTIHLNSKGKVDRAYLHVNEWRGFEKFCEGRPFFEMIQITPRICGICPVSHHLGAAKACDGVIGVTPPRPARLLRELMHMGQIIQSHSMHFFELAGPDLLLGFDADPAIRNIVGVIQANPELALKAVRLRGFGQGIISKLGVKRIHPNHSVPGGVNAPLSVKDRDEILSQIDDMTDVVKTGITVAKGWFEANMEVVNNFAVFPTGYMGMVDDEGGLQLYDGRLRLVDKNGKKLEEFDPRNYLDYICDTPAPRPETCPARATGCRAACSRPRAPDRSRARDRARRARRPSAVPQVHDREIHERAGIGRVFLRQLLELELGLQPVLRAHGGHRTAIGGGGRFRDRCRRALPARAAAARRSRLRDVRRPARSQPVSLQVCGRPWRRDGSRAAGCAGPITAVGFSTAAFCGVDAPHAASTQRARSASTPRTTLANESRLSEWPRQGTLQSRVSRSARASARRAPPSSSAPTRRRSRPRCARRSPRAT